MSNTGEGGSPGRQTLLAVFAHPDDETFLAGPILARYAHEGVRVELVVATAVDPDSAALPAVIAARGRALECAADRLGIARIHYLGYANAPMPVAPSVERTSGSPPASDQTRRDAGTTGLGAVGAVAGRIRTIMAGSKPDVVLVDSPYGAYGHPDHVLVHRAAVAAFAAWTSLPTTDSGTQPPAPAVGQPVASGARGPQDYPRLYALAFPMPLVRLNLRLLKLRGVKVGLLGSPGSEIDLEHAVRTARGKTGLVPVAKFVRYRRLAAACYEAEIRAAPLPLKLLERSPLWCQRLIFSRQAVTRLAPPTSVFERGLF